jgi:hypothetical protein
MLSQDQIEAANKARNRSEYDALPGLNQSTGRLFLRSIAHAHHSLTNPKEPTAAMRLGIYAHKAFLEPREWASYIHLPEYEGSKNSNEWKKIKADFIAANPEATIVSAEEHRDATAIAESLRRILPEYGFQIAAVEVGLTADYILPLKGSIDILGADGYIYDIKTTSDDATREDWGRNLEKSEELALQIAWYSVLFRENFGVSPKGFRHIVVETKAPFEVQVFEADEEIRNRGIESMLRVINQFALYKTFVDSGSPFVPGYPREIIKISPWKPKQTFIA